MKTKMALALSLVLVMLAANAQPSVEQQIKDVLNRQTLAWNQGDLEGYMQTYWKSDSLMFIGKNGVQWGWQQTLANYKKSYPSPAAMGQLSFEIVTIRQLSENYCYVVGRWMLQRSIGNLSGHFDLLLKKLNNNWVIVSDHSS